MNTLVPSQSEYAVMARQAKHLLESGLLPQAVNTPQKVIALMTLGRELNIPAWQSINGIHVIQGKPTVSPQLMLALIERSGQLEDVQIESSEKECTVTMHRKGRKNPHKEFFTIETARLMGLTNKDNWKKQPATMLKWRAVSACARVVFPDVICGLYLSEEISPDVHVTEDGELIQTEARVVESEEVSSKEKPLALPDEDLCTPNQWKLPWTALAKKGYSKEESEEWLRGIYAQLGYESTKQLPKRTLDKVLNQIEKLAVKEIPIIEIKNVRNQEKGELAAKKNITLKKAFEEVSKSQKISLRAKMALKTSVESSLSPDESKSVLEIVNDPEALTVEVFLEIAHGLLKREEA